MTMVLLGDYKSNEPLPTGLGFGMYSADAGTDWTYNNTVAPAALAGGQAGIGITPTRDCRWRVAAQAIWRSPDAQWTRADWGLHLTAVDLDGIQDHYTYTYVHQAIVWQHARCVGTYRLKAGVTYTCYPWWFASPIGWNQILYSAGYLSICGHILDQGGV